MCFNIPERIRTIAGVSQSVIIVLLVYVGLLGLAQASLAETSSQPQAFQSDGATEQTLLVLGDSLSAAYGLSSSDGWVALLQQRLDADGAKVKVINASVSGATTSAGLSMLPALLEQHHPAWVLIELGANDGLQGKPISYIHSNVNTLIDAVKASGAQPILFGMQLPPNLGDRYTKPFSELFEKIATEKSLPYVPFLLDGVAGNDELMQTDGLHPKANAQPRVLENVWPVIKPLIFSASKKQTSPI